MYQTMERCFLERTERFRTRSRFTGKFGIYLLKFDICLKLAFSEYRFFFLEIITTRIIQFNRPAEEYFQLETEPKTVLRFRLKTRDKLGRLEDLLTK